MQFEEQSTGDLLEAACVLLEVTAARFPETQGDQLRGIANSLRKVPTEACTLCGEYHSIGSDNDAD